MLRVHASLFSRTDFSIFFVAARRVGGFIFLGVIPVILLCIMGVSPKDYGLGAGNVTGALWIFWGLFIPVLLINYLNAGSKGNLMMYPQMRIQRWSLGLAVLSTILWKLYLLGYEFLFRGLLLFGCVNCCGVLPAVAINIALYALAHLPKGRKETIGSIPMGLFLCWMTLYTGSIWTAFAVHCLLALSNEYFSIWKGLKQGFIQQFVFSWR